LQGADKRQGQNYQTEALFLAGSRCACLSVWRLAGCVAWEDKKNYRDVAPCLEMTQCGFLKDNTCIQLLGRRFLAMSAKFNCRKLSTQMVHPKKNFWFFLYFIKPL